MTTGIEDALLELKEAERSQDSAAALQIVRDALGKLTDTDRRKLLDMDAVQRLIGDAEVRAREQMKPGSTVCDDKGRVIAKVPWTWDALIAEFGTVDWTPMQSRLISFNGIDLWVEAGRPCRTPPQFRDVAQEAWQAEARQLETQKEIMTRGFGAQGMILSGDGTELWRGKVQ